MRNKQGDTALECARSKAMRDLLVEHGAEGDVKKHQAEAEVEETPSPAEQSTTKKPSAEAADEEEDGEKSAKKLRHRTPRKNEDDSGTARHDPRPTTALSLTLALLWQRCPSF